MDVLALLYGQRPSETVFKWFLFLLTEISATDFMEIKHHSIGVMDDLCPKPKVVARPRTHWWHGLRRGTWGLRNNGKTNKTDENQ